MRAEAVARTWPCWPDPSFYRQNAGKNLPKNSKPKREYKTKTSSRVDTRLVSVASESDRGSIPLLSYSATAVPRHLSARRFFRGI